MLSLSSSSSSCFCSKTSGLLKEMASGAGIVVLYEDSPDSAPSSMLILANWAWSGEVLGMTGEALGVSGGCLRGKTGIKDWVTVSNSVGGLGCGSCSVRPAWGVLIEDSTIGSSWGGLATFFLWGFLPTIVQIDV